MHTLRLGTGLLLAEVVSSSTEATGPPRIHAAATAHLGLRAIPQVPQPAVHVQPNWVVTRPKQPFTSNRNGHSLCPETARQFRPSYTGRGFRRVSQAGYRGAIFSPAERTDAGPTQGPARERRRGWL